MESRKDNFSINIGMKRSDIQAAVKRAKDYFAGVQLSVSKRQVIDAVIDYAEKSLCTFSLIGKAANRYAIYSNIINFCEQFDDLHFLHYAAQQLQFIDRYENSTLRNTVLPNVIHKRDLLMTPEVARMQKAFMGMTAFGMATLVSGYSPAKASTCMMMGVLGYLGSYYLVLSRLDRSLSMKMNRMITNDSEKPLQLDDGLSDEFGTFQRAATGMLTSGLSIFNRVGDQFGRVAQLGNVQPQLSLQGAAPAAAPVIEEPEEEQAAPQMKRGK